VWLRFVEWENAQAILRTQGDWKHGFEATKQLKVQDAQPMDEASKRQRLEDQEYKAWLREHDTWDSYR